MSNSDSNVNRSDTRKTITFCPHIVEVNKKKFTKKEARKRLNIPQGAYTWVVNAKHYEQSNRKSYDDILMAFVEYLKEFPNSYLYMNNANTRKVRCPLEFQIPQKYPVGTIMHVPYGDKKIQVPYNPNYRPNQKYSAQIELTCKENPPGVYKIQKLADLLKIPKNKYHLNEMELSFEDLAALYHSADVLMACTKSEGFGLPVLEAQLIGTPVITTKFLAMGDFTFYGISVPPVQKLYQPLQTAFWVQPDIKGIVEAVKKLRKWSYVEHVAKKIMARSIIQTTMSFSTVKNIILSNIKTLNLKEARQIRKNKDKEKNKKLIKVEKAKLERKKNEKSKMEMNIRNKLLKNNSKKLEKEKLEKEKLEKEKLEKEKLEKERLEKVKSDKLEKERLEKVKKDKLEKERLEKVKKDKLEKERLEKVKKEKLAEKLNYETNIRNNLLKNNTKVTKKERMESTLQMNIRKRFLKN